MEGNEDEDEQQVDSLEHMDPEDVGKTVLKSVQQASTRRVTQFGGKDEAEAYVKTVYKSVLTHRQLPQAPKDQMLIVTLIQAKGLSEKWREAHSSRSAWRIFCVLDFQGKQRTTSSVPASKDPTFNEIATFALISGNDKITSSLKITMWASSTTQQTPAPTTTTTTTTGSTHAEGGRFRKKRNTSLRFLGQVLLKPSELQNMVAASGGAPLPLQKRNPRSNVKGSLALGIDVSTRQEVSRKEKQQRTKNEDVAAHEAATKARCGYWPAAPDHFNTVTTVFYEACYTIITYEATLMEVRTVAVCEDTLCGIAQDSQLLLLLLHHLCSSPSSLNHSLLKPLLRPSTSSLASLTPSFPPCLTPSLLHPPPFTPSHMSCRTKSSIWRHRARQAMLHATRWRQRLTFQAVTPLPSRL